MFKLIASSVKMLYRDKQALFWALAFPVIFVVVFGLFDFESGPDVRVAVVREPVSEEAPPGVPSISETLAGTLDDVDGFDISKAEDASRAKSRLRDGELDMVLTVDQESSAAPGTAGPGPSIPPAIVDLYYDQANAQENQMVISTITQVVDQMNLRLSGVSSPPISVERNGVAAKNADYFDFLLPGFVAMGVMNASIIGMAVAIAQFRQARILKRILATPLSPIKFLGAQVSARLLLALVQTGLILAVGVFVFGGTVYGDVLWLFVLAAGANIIFLNIGFAVAGRSPNPDAAQGVANAVALPMMFFSGVFFPTDTLPTIVQNVVQFLPLTPLIEAMRKVSVDGVPITDTGPELLQLVGWIGVSFLLASRLFRFAKT